MLNLIEFLQHVA